MGCRLCINRATMMRTCSAISQQNQQYHQLKRTLHSRQESKNQEPFTFTEFYRKIDYICKHYVDPYDQIKINQQYLNSVIDISQYKENKDVLFNEIKIDLDRKEKHLFREIVSSFSTMLIKIFQFPNWEKIVILQKFLRILQNFDQDSYISFKNESVSISQADRERLCSFEGNCTERVKTESTSIKIQGEFSKTVIFKLKSEKDLSKLLLKALDYVFTLLRRVLLQYYQKWIIEVAKDDLIEKEFILQRIIQQFILHRTEPLFHVINPTIHQYYCHENFKDYPRQPSLSTALMPVKGNQFMGTNSDTFNSSGILQSIVEQDEEDTPKGLNRKEVIEVIQRSESTMKVPYSQTFPIIKRIMKTRKFWKKVYLIEKLDKMIIQIYLFQRSEMEMVKLYDTISAEDSKAEILLFIIYKFSQTISKESLVNELFLPLKFMCDFDGVLHKDVKYVYQQSFMRFYSILEMLLLSDI